MDQLTQKVQRKYNRFARYYEGMESPMSWAGFNDWRKTLWQRARGAILEVGVGTGANLPFYPQGATVTAIDFSPRMLAKAEARAKDLGVEVDLRLMDAQAMEFADDSFDTVVTACVFCTVPDPIKGLNEIRRVLRPSGQLLMLEHIKSCGPILGPMMDLLDYLPAALVGTHINRDTVGNLKQAGFAITSLKYLWRDIFLEITASPSK